MSARAGKRLKYEWERQFDALNHHAIVSIANHKGVITYVNDLFCEISGFSRDELIGKNHRVVKSSQHSAEFYRDMWNTISNGNIWRGEICNKRKDGTNYWVESTIAPYIDETGQVYQYTSIRTDITDVKNSQTALKIKTKLQEHLTYFAHRLLICKSSELDDLIKKSLHATAEVIDSTVAFYVRFDNESTVTQAYYRADFFSCFTLFDKLMSDNKQLILSKISDKALYSFDDIFNEDVACELCGNFYITPVYIGQNIDRYIVYGFSNKRLSDIDYISSQIIAFADILGNAIFRVEITEELVSAKERLRLGQVFANIGTWEWIIATGDLYWSEKVYTLFGYDGQTINTSYENFIEAVHPDDRGLVEKAISQSLEYGYSYDVEHRIIRQDGTISWVSEKGSVVRDEHGAPLKMIGVVQDIDFRKSAQLALESRELDLKRAQSLAHIGSWNAYFTSGKIFWSEEVYNIFGLDPKTCEPTIELFHSCIHPDDYSFVRKNEDESKKTGNYEVEHRIVRPNGEIRWVHEIVETILDGNGDFYQMNGTVQDITERVKSDLRIRDVEGRFAFAVEGAGDGIWDWNILTGSMVHDRLYMEMLGYNENELPHHIDTWIESVHPEDLDNAKTILNEYLNGNRNLYSVEIRLKCKSGRFKWILCRGTIVERDREGQPTRMIGIHSDIDKFKDIQKQLTKSKEEAEMANKAKSAFLSSMSHELRTPLNSILGFSQIIQMDNESSDHNSENINEVIRAGRYLLNLINDILDLSKIEAGKLNLSIEPVSLKQVLLDSLAIIKPLANGRVSIEYADAEDFVVNADITRLKQCVINLLSNAIKYNKPNGKVTIIIEKNESHVFLNIEDTGVGLSEKEINKIFDPFNRLSHEDSGIEGTGIGLSITKQLMKMMSGTVRVKSRLGIGSVFSLKIPQGCFPLVSIEVDEKDDFSTQSELGFDKLVLYIDDNPSNLNLMEKLFSRMDGVDMISSNSPQLGISLALKNYPDLIILDINMPDIDGYQVLNILRNEAVLVGVPIIALTANAMLSDIENGLAAGFDDYISKPIDIECFHKKIKTLLK